MNDYQLRWKLNLPGRVNKDGLQYSCSLWQVGNYKQTTIFLSPSFFFFFNKLNCASPVIIIYHECILIVHQLAVAGSTSKISIFFNATDESWHTKIFSISQYGRDLKFNHTSSSFKSKSPTCTVREYYFSSCC